MKKYMLMVVLIIILLGILVHFGLVHLPGEDGYALYVRQKSQLHTIDSALELFHNDFESYPSSDANDPIGLSYCGAMKLTEALMGQDLLGFHTQSVFRRDGLDAAGNKNLYRNSQEGLHSSNSQPDLTARKGPFLPIEYVKAFRLEDIYGKEQTGPFPGDMFVLCDVFERKRPSGKKTGMPILYYRAQRDHTAHDVNDPNNPENIYGYRDNQVLITLGVPGDPNGVHPFSDPKRFYKTTQSHKVDTASQPYGPDTYLLMSAGYDGLYGTADDIVNCEWKYRH